VRDLIERRLAAVSSDEDPRERLLAMVAGPVWQSLLDAIARPAIGAAVLLGLVERPAGLTVLFTERASHLRDHPGQISFPGGRVAGGDAGPVATAVREAREEIGLEPDAVAVAGCLAPHLTVTGFAVTPVVGFIAGDFRPMADPAEVADVFEVPLDFVLEPSNMRTGYRERFGTLFKVVELRYGGHRIWGATAAMLMTFRNTVLYEKTIG
jgi:8-oxo-dGTP pyrophosphatase MutT (NUDIX family)